MQQMRRAKRKQLTAWLAVMLAHITLRERCANLRLDDHFVLTYLPTTEV